MKKGRFASSGGTHNFGTAALILLAVGFAAAFLVTLGILIGEKQSGSLQDAETASLPNEIAIISTTTVEIDAEQWANAEPDIYTDTFTFSASVVQGAPSWT